MPKKAKKTISLQEKLIILDKLDLNSKVSEIASQHGLNESTVRTIRDNRDKYKEQAKGGHLNLKRHRHEKLDKVETTMALWVNDCYRKRIPIDSNLIREKARRVFEAIEGPNDLEFVASKGWFERFKLRNNLKNVLVQGESSSADHLAATEYPPQLAKLIAEGGYSPEQLFNGDETGLYWKKMPSRTFIAKDEKTAPGHKVAKERLSVLLCSNAAGTLMTKPLVIHKSLHPRAFKGQTRLPVIYRANKKAWMTANIFEEWFKKHFVLEAEEHMKALNLNFKVLLILDNCSSHPANLSTENVKVVFLPPNTTSLIQPLDQGIIRQFKHYYLKRTFQIVFDQAEKGKDLKSAWKEYDMLQCVKNIALAAQDLKSSTLSNCWHKWLPSCEAPRTEECGIEEIKSTLRKFQGEGFGGIENKDIDELLQDIELTVADVIDLVDFGSDNEEEMDAEEEREETENDAFKPKTITSAVIHDALQKIEDAMKVLREFDPDTSRQENCETAINQAMIPYKFTVREMDKKRKQPTLDSIFAKQRKC